MSAFSVSSDRFAQIVGVRFSFISLLSVFVVIKIPFSIYFIIVDFKNHYFKFYLLCTSVFALLMLEQQLKKKGFHGKRSQEFGFERF